MVVEHTLFLLEVLGTVSFAMSGSFAAIDRKLDVFGVIIIAFVTAVGGGTLRDLLLGNTPVFWLKDSTLPVIILLTAIGTIIFKTQARRFTVTLFIFDTIGLALFTMAGIQQGLGAGMNYGFCVTLGTITGCFGGITRDILLNRIPLIFRKEIYATACIAGGCLYFILRNIGVGSELANWLSVGLIIAIRIVAVKFKLSLPPIN